MRVAYLLLIHRDRRGYHGIPGLSKRCGTFPYLLLTVQDCRLLRNHVDVSMLGTLYVVATPIGNLDDISPRALATLRNVSLIACEDTRVTARLLARYGIRTRTVSYHEHNEARRAIQLADKLIAGKDIALVSDAGTPGVSDPGYRLVSLARKRNIPIRTIPGPSAVPAALAVSGLPASIFCFFGFLPARPAARRKALDSLAETQHTVVLFESARRTPGLLRELSRRLGPRPAFVARELTKLHEEHRYGTLEELATWARETPLRGELTLILAGEQPRSRTLKESKPHSERAASVNTTNLYSRFQKLSRRGLTRREAVKLLARELGIPSRQIYRNVLDAESRLARAHEEDL